MAPATSKGPASKILIFIQAGCVVVYDPDGPGGEYQSMESGSGKAEAGERAMWRPIYG